MGEGKKGWGARSPKGVDSLTIRERNPTPMSRKFCALLKEKGKKEGKREKGRKEGIATYFCREGSRHRGEERN